MAKKSNTSARWLAVVTVAFIFAITLAPPLQHYFAQRAQINSLRAQVNDSNSALEKAREELAKWNDPEYVATQARSRCTQKRRRSQWPSRSYFNTNSKWTAVVWPINCIDNNYECE